MRHSGTALHSLTYFKPIHCNSLKNEMNEKCETLFFYNMLLGAELKLLDFG
jgi:hypothetical protein